jgi:hypothetical protein
MIRSEAKSLLARKLDIDLTNIATNDLFTEADLESYLDTGLKRGWDYKPWTPSEKTYTTTSTADGYYDYPEDFEDESITRLTVAGEEYDKKNFDDYQKFLADNPTSDEKIWSEHQRYYFVNGNAHTVGDSIDVTGKLRAPTLSSDADKLPFSPSTDNQENSGNGAIVDLAYAEALESEKMKQETKAANKRKDAYGVLDVIWKPMGARRSKEQSKDRPFFDVPDFFAN